MKQNVNIIPNSNQRTDLCRKKCTWTEIYIMRNLKKKPRKFKKNPTYNIMHFVKQIICVVFIEYVLGIKSNVRYRTEI